SSRQHNDTNVLVLAATKVSDRKALEITRVWLKTKALKGRHARRVRQIKAIEKKEFKKGKK
ncbi:MAG: RpiB/LacA/LacB family sugar-phosphate isomerase, partial [Candidatus Omnitrophota bacterium]